MWRYFLVLFLGIFFVFLLVPPELIYPKAPEATLAAIGVEIAWLLGKLDRKS